MTHNSVLRVLFCWKRPACFHRICRGNITGTHFLGSFNLFLNVVFIIGEQNPAKISGALEDCNLCNLGIWGDSLLSGHEGWVQRLPTKEAIANFGKLKTKHAPSPPRSWNGAYLWKRKICKASICRVHVSWDHSWNRFVHLPSLRTGNSLFWNSSCHIGHAFRLQVI